MNELQKREIFRKHLVVACLIGRLLASASFAALFVFSSDALKLRVFH